MSGLGASYMKIWTCGSSPRGGSQNVWTRIKTSTVPVVWVTFGIFSARSKWFPVAIGDHGRYLVISLWPGDKATFNGVATWRLTSPQKIPSAKICWKISRLDFLGLRGHPPHWLSSKGSNYQRGVLLISAGAIEWRFEENAAGMSPRVSCSTMPNSPGTCNSEETDLPGLPVSWSPSLFSRSGPAGMPPVTWTEKNNWKFAICRLMRSSLLPRRPGWSDKLLNLFLSGLQKLEQRGKKFVEFRGEYVE